MDEMNEQELKDSIVHMIEQIENIEGMIQVLLKTKNEIETQISEQETENNIEKK